MPGPGGCVGRRQWFGPVGRGLDPSAGGCPGDGRWREVSRGVGDAAPYGLPGNGRQREAAAGWGTPPYGWGYGNTVGLTRVAVPGPPFPSRRAVGAGHARPGGLRGRRFAGLFVGRGLDPSAGGCPGDGCWREALRGVGDAAPYGLPGKGRQRGPAPHPALRGHLPPRGKARAVWRQREPPPTPAAGPRCGAGGSGCSTSGLTKPALYRRNPGKCRGGSRR